MTIESAQYLNDLVTANPAGSDDLAEGDNHIRLLKVVLRNTFPGFNGRLWRVVTQSGGLPLVATHNSAVIVATANITVTPDAAATLGAGFLCYLIGNGGKITVDPAGTEKVNGVNTVDIPDGFMGILICTGVKFFLAIVPIGLPYPVAAGGTGRATLTPFNVLAAGALEGDPIALLAPGAEGRVLTSQGADTLPAFLPPGGPISAGFESAEIAIVGATQRLVAHGLGGVPKFAMAILRCVNATAGWAVGDEVQLTSFAFPSGFFTSNKWIEGQGYTVWANATQVGVSYNLPNNQIMMQRKDGSASVNIPFVGLQGGVEGHDAFSFRWVLRAWR